MKATVFGVLMATALLGMCSAAPTRSLPFARLSKPIEQHTGYSLLGISEAEHIAAHGKVSDKVKMETAMKVATKAGEAPAFGTCMNCVYVLERIKQGYQYLLPSICVEIFSKEGASKGKEAYGMCHQVLASLSVWGNNVRHWFHYGCYKSEVYGAMELIRPCPSHVICAQMADFEKKTFCKKLDQDKLLDA